MTEGPPEFEEDDTAPLRGVVFGLLGSLLFYAIVALLLL